MKPDSDSMPTFSLEGRDHVALNALLKFEGWCASGGAAKHEIDAGHVQVNGTVELRRRCKVVAGQVVEMHGNKIRVID